MAQVLAGLLACVLAVSALTGCSRSKEDIIETARAVGTRAQLEQALGKPSDISKLGPVERWTYRASNGEVVFLIVGEKVALQATGAPPPDKR